MSFRSRKYLTTAAIVLLIVGSGALPAQAETTPPIAPKTLAQLNANFDALGVASNARAGLLQKYAEGKGWDNSSGVAPAKVNVYRIGITKYVRDVYPDGSVTLTSVQQPTTPTTRGSISPMGISGCTYMLSTGVATYSNCQVEKNNGILTMWFHADYWQYSGGSGVSLTNTWDWDIQAAGGACAFYSLGTPTANKARLRAYCTVVTGIGSSYPYLDLDVTSYSATVNANW